MDVTVLAKYVRESDSGEAILVRQGAYHVWIPRSQISYLKKEPDKSIVMSIPEWMAKRKNLSYE